MKENGKELLYRYYFSLTEEVKGKKVNIDQEIFEESLQSTSFEQLIKYINDTIKILVKKKVTEGLNEAKSIKKEKLSREALYEQKLKYSESKERNLVKQIFQLQLQKDAMNHRINDYLEMEEEFEELKTKLHYQNGKFLNNDRKENEIIILRKENTNLKTSIEEKEKKVAKMLKEKEAQINELKMMNQNLKKTLEEKQKELNSISNMNINLNTNEILSKKMNKKISNTGLADTDNYSNNTNTNSTNLFAQKGYEASSSGNKDLSPPSRTKKFSKSQVRMRNDSMEKSIMESTGKKKDETMSSGNCMRIRKIVPSSSQKDIFIQNALLDKKREFNFKKEKKTLKNKSTIDCRSMVSKKQGEE